MSRLNPQKLHVRFSSGATEVGPLAFRRYTLTHSDASGDLYLTVGLEFDRDQISGLYTRLMRDEVLAEWREEGAGPSLHVYCHVSGGWVFGTASFRYAIFRRELPLALEAIRFGDRHLLESRPGLDGAPILIHFQSTRARYHRIENWGTLARYQATAIA